MRMHVALVGFCGLFFCFVAATSAPVEKLPPLPAIDVSYTKTVLGNGLTLVVHEDHKAPVVAVNVWYHVGSRNEPAGRTGFAHLFEHLMFGGKNGTQKGWFEKMQALGATDLNGTTNHDRTNFFETVPTAALDTTLFLEAQRMGHLLDDFNETVFVTQRGVVENEKRQHDNQPYAVADELITKSVWPASHPYSHTVIGEMNDLEAAKIEDVKDWFAKYYGPSNAVIAISGDVNPADVEAKVEKYFGAIPPGPPVARYNAWIARRTGEQRATAEDHVALARLYKVWNVPGSGSADLDLLDLVANLLSVGQDSRLSKRLVYQDKIATEVSVYVDERELAGLFQVEVTAKPGVSLDRIEAVVNEELAKLLRNGPAEEELERAKTRGVSSIIRQMERVGGFGGTSDILAESQTYLGAPDAWKKDLDKMRRATPAEVTAAGRRWLRDGAFTLQIKPFPSYTAANAPAASLPEPGSPKLPGFVPLQRAKLSNGLNVVVVERHATPTLVFDLQIDSGKASEQFAKPGVEGLAANGLFNGTAKMDAMALSDRIGSLGITMGRDETNDFLSLYMTALTPRLDQSLALFADVVLHPAYRADDVARDKSLTLAAIQEGKDNPGQAAMRLVPVLVYGRDHAYGRLITEADVSALTPEDLRSYHDLWFRPDNATLVVSGDTTLAKVLPMIEAHFGAWKQNKAPEKHIAAVAAVPPAIYLIDKPGAQQSVIVAASTAPPRADSGDIAIRLMNSALGGSFTSRLNMNLREAKHWSYGAGSFLMYARGPSVLGAYASVQTDKTADALAEMRKELVDIVTSRPVTPDELTLAQKDFTRSLPGRWETNWSVADSVGEIAGFGLRDDYYETYAQRVHDLGIADVNAAARTVVRPEAFTWIVVGDRLKVMPGLSKSGLPVRCIDTDAKPLQC